MPVAYINKLVDQGKGTKADLEKKWDKAKKLASDQGHADEFDYITGIFNKMIGESRMMSFKTYITESVIGDRLDSILADIKKVQADKEILNPAYQELAKGARRFLGNVTKTYKDTIYSMIGKAYPTRNAPQDFYNIISEVPWDSFQTINKFKRELDKFSKKSWNRPQDQEIANYIVSMGGVIADSFIPVADGLKDIKKYVVKVSQKRAAEKAAQASVTASKFADSSTLVDALSSQIEEYKKEVRRQAISFIDKKMKKLDEVDMDLNKLVPGTFASREQLELKAFYRMITSPANKGYNPNGPDTREINGKGVRKYIDMAIDQADKNYKAFIHKMVEKIGKPVTEAGLKGRIWTNALINVTTIDGEKQIWKTQAIINFSKYGKPFNQFPTRRKK